MDNSAVSSTTCGEGGLSRPAVRPVTYFLSRRSPWTQRLHQWVLWFLRDVSVPGTWHTRGNSSVTDQRYPPTPPTVRRTRTAPDSLADGHRRRRAGPPCHRPPLHPLHQRRRWPGGRSPHHRPRRPPPPSAARRAHSAISLVTEASPGASASEATRGRSDARRRSSDDRRRGADAAVMGPDSSAERPLAPSRPIRRPSSSARASEADGYHLVSRLERHGAAVRIRMHDTRARPSCCDCPAFIGWVATSPALTEPRGSRPRRRAMTVRPSAPNVEIARRRSTNPRCASSAIGAEPMTYLAFWPELPDDAGLGGSCAASRDSRWRGSSARTSTPPSITTAEDDEPAGTGHSFPVNIDPATGVTSMPERGHVGRGQRTPR